MSTCEVSLNADSDYATEKYKYKWKMRFHFNYKAVDTKFYENNKIKLYNKMKNWFTLLLAVWIDRC